jgi:Spy/CpxP family protein refolding chaperone
MTDHETSPTQPASAAPEPQQSPRRSRRYLTVAAIVLAAGLTGAVATKAFSESGFGRGGWHGPGFGHGMMGGRIGGPIDPARAERRADRMVRHLSIEIDASAEQQEKLRAIVKSAVKDLVPLREKAQAARQKARQLLTQPTIDRAAIEAFRAEQVAQLDAVSKRLAQALTEAAEVLTPEQRQQISEHMERRRSRWRGWHRG